MYSCMSTLLLSRMIDGDQSTHIFELDVNYKIYHTHVCFNYVKVIARGPETNQV